MANHTRIASASAIAGCNAIVDLVDVGEGAGAVVLYTGDEPSYANDAAGTKVATCVCADPAFGAAVADGVNHWAEADLSSTASDSDATGNVADVSYFRLEDPAGGVVLQGTAGTSGTDLVLNRTIVNAGAQVDITGFQVRFPYNQA